MSVYSWEENKLEAEQVNFITDVQVTIFFKVPKHIIKNECTSMKQIPPKSLYSLVMATLLSYKTMYLDQVLWIDWRT